MNIIQLLFFYFIFLLKAAFIFANWVQWNKVKQNINVLSLHKVVMANMFVSKCFHRESNKNI